MTTELLVSLSWFHLCWVKVIWHRKKLFMLLPTRHLHPQSLKLHVPRPSILLPEFRYVGQMVPVACNHNNTRLSMAPAGLYPKQSGTVCTTSQVRLCSPAFRCKLETTCLFFPSAVLERWSHQTLFDRLSNRLGGVIFSNRMGPRCRTSICCSQLSLVGKLPSTRCPVLHPRKHWPLYYPVTRGLNLAYHHPPIPFNRLWFVIASNRAVGLFDFAVNQLVNPPPEGVIHRASFACQVSSICDGGRS